MRAMNISAYIIPATDAHLVHMLSIIIMSSEIKARVRLLCLSLCMLFTIRVNTLHHVTPGWPS